VSDLRRFQHPRFARQFERLSVLCDERGMAEHRRRLAAGLRGRVVEVGAGNGRMFAHYPPEVTEVVAVEPDDTLRASAQRAAGDAPVPVEVRAGHADRLPVEARWADAVVVAGVLCSVPDQATALTEIIRVLRPGGELRYYEHVRSGNHLLAVVQDLLTPMWSRAAAGCHPNRRTSEAIRASGLVVQHEDRFAFQPLRLSPARDHILGAARRPVTS
jgi:ubiquinone/menaquinone biosynthesis C-methylase UbiE